MKKRYVSIFLFRFAAVCAAFCAVTVAKATPSASTLNVTLTFDEDSLADGTTGTFTISGGADSNSGGSGGWQTSGSAGSSPGWLTFNVGTLDASAVAVTYNGNAFSLNMGTAEFLYVGGDSIGLIIGGSSTGVSPNYLQIGNGTTDYISGTFVVSGDAGIGSTSVADLNLSISNVTVTASVIPEPATYATLVGAAVLGLVVLRRRRRSEAV